MGFRLQVWAVSVAAGLGGCASLDAAKDPGSFCSQEPAVCTVLGVAVVAGATMLLRSGKGDREPVLQAGGGPGRVSDERLKEVMRPIDQLPNGLWRYAFRYRGDPGWFVGVSAQEVLARPELAHAAAIGPHGYLRVDYGALGLRITNEPGMRLAGQQAEAAAVSSGR